MHEYEVRAQPLRDLCIESNRISESTQGAKIAFFADALMSLMYIENCTFVSNDLPVDIADYFVNRLIIILLNL